MFEIVEIETAQGGKIGLGPQPNSAQDFEHIAKYNPKHLITLTENHEWQLDDFPDYAEDSAENWHHHAVRDFTAANETINPLLDVLNASLSRKERIFIHCRGGCGRAGMLTMRLLIMQGEDVDQALPRLRKVRPCAVETKEQEFWASFGLNA